MHYNNGRICQVVSAVSSDQYRIQYLDGGRDDIKTVYKDELNPVPVRDLKVDDSCLVWELRNGFARVPDNALFSLNPGVSLTPCETIKKDPIFHDGERMVFAGVLTR